MFLRMTRFAAALAAVTLLCAPAISGEKALMHCFAFTEIEGAAQADWDAVYKATDELPGKIDGLNKVWVGKLRRPLSQYDSQGERIQRQHGVCMEMADEKALENYAKHEAHAEWVKVYEKVRVPGTTTYDILGR